ncbi:MAG: photosynthetic complex putative assembly protein PuhB, partial [Burkholderiaceae bacterium]
LAAFAALQHPSAVLALVAWGVLCWWAWLSARTTLYTLTNKRVVMRIGIVLTLTLNLPLRRLAGAAIKQGRHGVGDVSVTLVDGDRMGWAHLWPHARPWHVKQPQPSLRGVADVQRVAQLLQQAWRAANPDVAVTVAAQGEGAMAERHQPSVVMS